MAVLELGKTLLQQQRGAAHLVEKAGCQHHVEHGIAGRHGELIAPEGRPVGAGRHAFRRLGGGEASADRKAAAERLGERHDVRLDAGALVGEEVAGAAHAGLHLVEYQQQAVLVAQRAQRAQELERHDAYAAFRLDRLDHRPEAVEIFLLAAGRERRERAAVKRALEGENAKSLGRALR